METTKTNDSTTSFGKEFKDTNTAITDMYSKQLNLITGFYTNVFNSMMDGNKGWKQDNGFVDIYKNNGLAKIVSNSFGGAGNSFQSSFPRSFEKIYSQMADYNRNLFATFNSESKNGTVDLNEITKKYKETIASRLEVSQSVLKSTTEAYNKQFNAAIETNKKMMEDINTQFNLIVEQTQKFWADILKTDAVQLNEESAYIKESNLDGNKKRMNISVNEFMDHKGK